MEKDIFLYQNYFRIILKPLPGAKGFFEFFLMFLYRSTFLKRLGVLDFGVSILVLFVGFLVQFPTICCGSGRIRRIRLTRRGIRASPLPPEQSWGEGLGIECFFPEYVLQLCLGERGEGASLGQDLLKA